MTEANDPDVVALSDLVYGVIHNEEGSWQPISIPDCAAPDIESAYSWFMVDNDAVWMEVVKLNPNDFWRGYFYYNDMEPPEDACELECNTRKHLDLHWDTNCGGGHYDCTHYYHVVNGEGVETIKHDNQNWYDQETIQN